MEQDKFTLKLNASRLGTIQEITSMLSDLDSAYNNLYMFNIIVESISERKRLFTSINDSVYPYYKEWYNELPPKIQRNVAPYHMLVKNNLLVQGSFQHETKPLHRDGLQRLFAERHNRRSTHGYQISDRR